MKQKDYHNIFPLCSMGNRGFTVEQRNQLLSEHFNNIQRRLGSIESVDLISCETKRVEGDRASGEYIVTFDVSRSIKQSNREVFRLLLECSANLEPPIKFKQPNSLANWSQDSSSLSKSLLIPSG